MNSLNLDLAPSHCTQLAVSLDLRIEPERLGRLRNTVEAMYPRATFPWYFREMYRTDRREYEVVASVGPSSAGDPSAPFNVYVRWGHNTQTQPYETPTVRGLLETLAHDAQVPVFCTAVYGLREGSGTPVLQLPVSVDGASLDGPLHIIGYRLFLLDQGGNADAAIGISRSPQGDMIYEISFYEVSALTAELPPRVLNRASQVLGRVHQVRKRGRARR